MTALILAVVAAGIQTTLLWGYAGADTLPAASALGPATPGIPVAASPTVRRLARQMGIDLATVTPRLPGGRLSAEDLATGHHGGGPAARPASA